MPQVIFQSMIGSQPRRHFRETVMRAVELAPYAETLGPQQSADLAANSRQGLVRLWGFVPKHQAIFDRMTSSDIILFHDGQTVLATARVGRKFVNESLALDLWGRDLGTGPTWELMFTLEETKSGELDLSKAVAKLGKRGFFPGSGTSFFPGTSDTLVSIRESLSAFTAFDAEILRGSQAENIPLLGGYVCVFVALREELNHLTSWNLRRESGARRLSDQSYLGMIPGGPAVRVLPAGSAGRISAALTTYEYLSEAVKVPPSLFLVLGMAGGFAAAGVKRGDVVVATSIVDLSERKIFGAADGARQARAQTFEVDQRVVRAVNDDVGHNFALHFGAIASGDEVVASAAYADLLRGEHHSKPIAVEMEAGGVAAAARWGARPAIPFGVIRGISDLADEQKEDDEYRSIAMERARRVTEQALLRLNLPLN